MKNLFNFGFVLLAALSFAQAQAGDTTSALQQGLLEEEANHNLDAAIQAYQSVVSQFDKERKLAATALYRLGECYRKLGRTNEATAQYERLLRDFSDETTLANLSRQNLAGLRPADASAATPAANDQAVATDGERAKIRQIRAMIENSPDLINRPDDGGNPPLVAAAFRDEVGVLRFLLKNGADVKARAPDGVTALFAAAGSGHKRAVEILLANGADPNAPHEGQTGVQFGERLASSGAASLSSMRLWNATALHVAAAKGFASVVEVLLANKANPAAETKDGYTALHLAAVNGQTAVVKMLIEHGADVNAKIQQGTTPLHLAASHANLETVTVLLTKGVDVNARDDQGFTPLHETAAANRAEVVKALLSRGAKIDAPTLHGNTPLILAIRSGSADAVDALLERGADPNLPGVSTTRATTSSANVGRGRGGGGESSGSDPATDSPGEWAPLHYAAYPGNLRIVSALLRHGAKVNSRTGATGPIGAPNRFFENYMGATPLYLAVVGGRAEVVHELLDNQADPKIATSRGALPLDFAIAWRRPELVEQLLQRDASPNRPPEVAANGAKYEEWTAALPPLQAAVVTGDKSIVELILAHHPEINAVDRNGKTALDRARGKPEIEALLRKNGALEIVPRFDLIQLSRPSANQTIELFQNGTNGWNHFTLLEAIGQCYGLIVHPVRSGPAVARMVNANSDPFRFPDFRHIAIHRPSATGDQWGVIPVDLTAAAKTNPCTADVPLLWGDVIEIPETDHPVNENWTGLTSDENAWIGCLARNFTVLVKGVRNPVHFAPSYKDAMIDNKYEILGFSYMVRAVLDQSKLIRFSSDLANVKITRRDAKSNQEQTWTLDCSDFGKSPDLWLRDGDVIEVPDN